jgi:hypothetical protein
MKEKLLKQGADAAQRAIRHYLKDEYDQFFIQAGISFELLGKARLAAIPRPSDRRRRAARVAISPERNCGGDYHAQIIWVYF